MFHFKNKVYCSFMLIGLPLTSCNGHSQTSIQTINPKKEIMSSEKIKVEIWSDVMCPFCYIGKRKFETALAQFKDKDKVEIVWKSFQLNADLKTDPSKNTIQHLAESKGWTMEYTISTVQYVMEMAEGVGLHYDFNKAVVANSFDAHRLIQFAKSKDKGDAAEERLFKAYFTEGKNTADHTVLLQLGKEIGLEETELKQVLDSDAFAKEVKNDIQEAEKIGVSGVPFFVFNRKYAVSGAQDPEVFLKSLIKASEEKSK
jgi:predicted DsbA family dithiol-disulfide isomerase